MSNDFIMRGMDGDGPAPVPSICEEIMLKEGERIDDLMYKGMRIIQKEKAFRFGTDSVLLADFACARPGDIVADFGAGTGVLALLMAGRQESARFDAFELQADMADMAARSVALNKLEERIRIWNADLRDAPELVGYGKHSLVVCNPPYSPAGTALASRTETKKLARHEYGCTVQDIAKAASALLKNGGRIAMIYPAPRIFDLMYALRECRLEPKRIRTVHSMAGRAPKLILLDAVKGAGSMLHWMEPLVLSHADGTPTDEWKRIYHMPG